MEPPAGKLLLAIESSCDETAAAVIDRDRRVLSNVVATQHELHERFGGVVPELAARAHVEMAIPLVEAALADAGVTMADVDAIAATAGPGLIGGVMVGLMTGKALAHAMAVGPGLELGCRREVHHVEHAPSFLLIPPA